MFDYVQFLLILTSMILRIAGEQQSYKLKLNGKRMKESTLTFLTPRYTIYFLSTPRWCWHIQLIFTDTNVVLSYMRKALGTVWFFCLRTRQDLTVKRTLSFLREHCVHKSKMAHPVSHRYPGHRTPSSAPCPRARLSPSGLPLPGTTDALKYVENNIHGDILIWGRAWVEGTN